ncbi:MAG: DUF1841 family protein [Zetaproteobacteria bacterium]|nr:MAG: DUF1841 family protein [Zetaproteobacteria bacterium]
MDDARQNARVSREALRRHREVWWEAWRKAQEGLPLNALEVRIVRVIRMHPEYHHLFDDKERFLDRDFAIEDGLNPYLHMSLHLALEEQIATRQPPEAAEALLRLMERGLSRHEALHQLLEILGEVVYFAQRAGREPDVALYAARLRELARR